MAKKNSSCTSLRRSKPHRSLFQGLFIFTEGRVTEKQYLKIVEGLIANHFGSKFSFNCRYIETKNKSSPKNIRDAILKTLRELENLENYSREIWVLIDKDSWKQEDIDELFKLNQKPDLKSKVNSINILMSDPKFEIWLLLHFEEANGVSTSREIDIRLKKFLPDYNKHCSPSTFSMISVTTAIQRAKKKEKIESSNVRAPVYKLIERMFELAKNQQVSPGVFKKSI